MNFKQLLSNKKLNNVKTVVGELSKEAIEKHPILKDKFDLIVASSVCAFLPNYEEVLSIIKSLLKPKGIFVQWDWLRTEKDPNFGFTEGMIREHYSSVGLKIDSISVPFHIMENDEQMEVLMSVGKL
jgi:SAM-dependent methyltransferase